MPRILKPTSLPMVGSWNLTGELSRFAYRDGYLRAAELLAEAIDENGACDAKSSSIIYPTLHLYRHFVELTLKDFIDLAVFVGPYLPDLYDADQVREERKRITHDLQKAYGVVRSIVESLYNPSTDFMQHMDDCCLELVAWFQEHDRKGDGFRYTLNVKAKAQFLRSFPVDFAWLRSCVNAFDRCMHEEHDSLRSLLDPEAGGMHDRIYHW